MLPVYTMDKYIQWIICTVLQIALEVTSKVAVVPIGFYRFMKITFNTCVKNTPLCGKTLLKSEIIVLQLSHLIFGVKYLLDNLQLAPF